MGSMDMHTNLLVLIERHLKAGRKGALLDQYCVNTGQNRTYVIRKIRRIAYGTACSRKKGQRRNGPGLLTPLSRVWKVFDHPCGQRLHPTLVTEIERLRRQGAIRIDDATAEKLRTISPATIDRVLHPIKGTPTRSQREKNMLYRHIPLRMTEWDVEAVRYLEIDLVFHCGASTEGDFVSTLAALDIGSGWWEVTGEGVMGRSQARAFSAPQAIRSRTPFVWKAIDSDNDSMFINSLLLGYAREHGLTFTRSRPYRKNDTHVRKPFGYVRYDTEEEGMLINDLYRNELRLCKNFFQPVMKLIKKERIDGNVNRVYHEPQTPYRRLVANQIPHDVRQALEQEDELLNPAELKQAIDTTLERLFRLYEHKKGTLRVNPYRATRFGYLFADSTTLMWVTWLYELTRVAQKP